MKHVFGKFSILSVSWFEYVFVLGGEEKKYFCSLIPQENR